MRLQLALCCTLLLASIARAQEPRVREQAELRVEQGRQLFNNNDFLGALEQFKQAYTLTRSWRVLIHVGVTQSRLLRYDEAMAALERYLREGGEQIPADYRTRVELELKKLRGLLAEVTVQVRGGSARVEVDGRPVGRAPPARPLRLGPGPHKFRAVRDGFEPDEKEVTLEPGGTHHVVLIPVRQTGLLRVDSRPHGARLAVDGREVGRTPWEQRLPARRYRLRAELEGHLVAQQSVILQPRQQRDLMITLVARPRPPPRPWYKRWYWWTAIGATVTAAVVVGAVVGTRPHYDITIRGDDRPVAK